MKNVFKVSLLGLILGLSTNASAVMLGFDCITNTSMANCAIGESQLSVDVTAQGSDQVLFTFANTGSDNNSVAEIYFDDGTPAMTLGGINSLIQDPGVAFTEGTSGSPTLPGGNGMPINFNTTDALFADADNPAPQNGINNGETLGILFDLLMGANFDDVIDALSNGDLRVGIHVISIGLDDNSESFINTPVPVPAAVWMLGAGFLGLMSFGRRKV